jgi:hypothetical protein
MVCQSLTTPHKLKTWNATTRINRTASFLIGIIRASPPDPLYGRHANANGSVAALGDYRISCGKPRRARPTIDERYGRAALSPAQYVIGPNGSALTIADLPAPGMNLFRRLHSADEAFRDRAIMHFASGQQDGRKSPFSISECVYLLIDLIDSSGALLCRYCWRIGLLCRRTFIARQLDDTEPRKPLDVIVCADGDLPSPGQNAKPSDRAEERQR